MKERPILFSDEMVRAILEGRKTQTRRVIKNKAVLDSLNEVGSWDGPGEVEDWERSMCPYGAQGDRLWVRESHTFAPYSAFGHCDKRPHPDGYNAAYYRADWDRSQPGMRWRPSIHMPRWASRITLEILRVRVQRVQQMRDRDAYEEGVSEEDDYPMRSFRALWDSIYAKRRYSFDSNPWVWAIEFKRIESK